MSDSDAMEPQSHDTGCHPPSSDAAQAQRLAAARSLAQHLNARRPAILQAWRQTADTAGDEAGQPALSLRQFIDDVPRMLDALEQRLRSAQPWQQKQAQEGSEGKAGHEGSAGNQDAAQQGGDSAADHGRERWAQGYSLGRVVDELVRLQGCIADEIIEFEVLHPHFGARAMGHARGIVHALFGRMVVDSTTAFAQLRRTEAEARGNALQLALERLNELELERARLWSDVSHDLRGTLGVVVSAAEGLDMHGAEGDQTQARFLTLLRRNVGALHTLIDDLLSLTRLQAGRKLGPARPFDAAAAVARVANRVQLSHDRLELNVEGPAPFPVQLDPAWFDEMLARCLGHLMRADIGRVRVQIRWGASSDAPLPAGDHVPPQFCLEFRAEPALQPALQPAPRPPGAASGPALRSRRVVDELSALSLRRLADLGLAQVQLPPNDAPAGAAQTLRVCMLREQGPERPLR